jgi:hypothetical protein
LARIDARLLAAAQQREAVLAIREVLPHLAAERCAEVRLALDRIMSEEQSRDVVAAPPDSRQERGC